MLSSSSALFLSLGSLSTIYDNHLWPGPLIQTGLYILFKRKWNMKTVRHNVYDSWELSHSNGSSLVVNIFWYLVREIPLLPSFQFSWKVFAPIPSAASWEQQHSPHKFSFILNLVRANLCCVLTATRRPQLEPQECRFIMDFHYLSDIHWHFEDFFSSLILPS